jgi:hypothetical protein
VTGKCAMAMLAATDGTGGQELEQGQGGVSVAGARRVAGGL